MPCCGGGADEWRPLNRRQRAARLIVGSVLLLFAVVLPWSTTVSIAIAAILGWVGGTHVLSAAMAYPGCPELGAVPSLLLGRSVKTACVPWRWLDSRLRPTVK